MACFGGIFFAVMGGGVVKIAFIKSLWKCGNDPHPLDESADSTMHARPLHEEELSDLQ